MKRKILSVIDRKIEKVIRENGMDIAFGRGIDGSSEAMEAAVKGDWHTVMDLVERGADVDTCYIEDEKYGQYADYASQIYHGCGRSLLYFAVEAENLEAVKFLLDHGASVYTGARGDWAAIYRASEKSGCKNQEIIDLVQRAGEEETARRREQDLADSKANYKTKMSSTEWTEKLLYALDRKLQYVDELLHGNSEKSMGSNSLYALPIMDENGIYTFPAKYTRAQYTDWVEDRLPEVLDFIRSTKGVNNRKYSANGRRIKMYHGEIWNLLENDIKYANRLVKTYKGSLKEYTDRAWRGRQITEPIRYYGIDERARTKVQLNYGYTYKTNGYAEAEGYLSANAIVNGEHLPGTFTPEVIAAAKKIYIDPETLRDIEYLANLSYRQLSGEA